MAPAFQNKKYRNRIKMKEKHEMNSLLSGFGSRKAEALLCF
jgi:hypothetical protein